MSNFNHQAFEGFYCIVFRHMTKISAAMYILHYYLKITFFNKAYKMGGNIIYRK